MVSYNPRQLNPSTSNQHPLPTVIHSPHPPHRSSHILVQTNTIVTPKIPTFFHRYHHHYHTLSILLYQRWSLLISVLSTLIYMVPIFVTSIVVSMTWKDPCNRALHAYLYGVLLHTILSLFCYILYLRKSSHPTIILSTPQHALMLTRWLVTLGSMIWMLIGTYWIATSKTCMTISPLLYYTSLLLVICFYISHMITMVLTFITCFAFRTCMKKLSLYEHSEGLLRCVPVKVFEPDQARSTAHCHLCLASYHATQQLRQFSTCHHSFHRTCAEQWLSLCTTCPLCHVSAFYDNPKKNEHDDGARARFEASSQGPVSEASRGRATTQMMVSHDETTPTRTTPHPASTSQSSAFVSHDEVDLFMNPVMNALQASQDHLRTRPDSHHKSQQSVPPSQMTSQHLRPPAPRGSQTHRPSLIRSMSNPTGQWDASHPVLRTMSDPIGRQEKGVDDDLSPYDYDSDEESRDIVRLRRLRSFAKNRPAFIRPLPKPRSVTEPNTPRDRKPFTLPFVPGSRNDSDGEDGIEMMDEIPGQAPGNMVMTRHMMMDVTLSPVEDPRNTRRIMTQPSSPRTRKLHLMTEMDDDDTFIEKPDPVLNTTPHNILMQQMAGYRVRRTLSIEGIAEAKASEERMQQMKQNKQRHDEMAQLKSFAQQLKMMKIPTFQQPKRSQPPPPPTPPQTYQPQPQQQQKQQPPLPQIPQHQQRQQQQQQQHQQQHHHHQQQQQHQQQSQYQPQSRVPQRPHAQTMHEPHVKTRGSIPTFDPRIPQQRQHAHTVTQYDAPSQHRSNHYQDIPRQHSKSQWTPSPHFQPPPPPLPPPQQPYQPSYQEYS